MILNGFDAMTSAPAPKRSRRNNGTTTAASSTNVNGSSSRGTKSGDGMEVDQQHQQNGISHQGEAAPKRDPANSPAASAAAAAAAIALSGGNEMDVEMEATTTTNSTARPDQHHHHHHHHHHQGHQNHAMDIIDTAMTDDGAVAVVEGDANGDQSESDSHSVQAPPVVVLPTLINGRSVGVQSDKVADLGPETTVLSVAGKNVTHAVWNPRDPTLLAAGGDALCRIWSLHSTLARSAAAATSTSPTEDPSSPGETIPPSNDDSAPNPSSPSTSSLVSRQIMDMHDPLDDSSVTAMAWSPDGERLAIAKHPRSGRGRRGGISIRSKAGETVDELPGGQNWVLHLQWNPSGTLLFGVEHSDESSSTLMVWDIASSQPLDPFVVQKPVMAAVWTDDRTLRLCGNDFLATATIVDGHIESQDERHDGQPAEEWAHICYDNLTQSTAISSESSGTLALIDNSGKLHTTKAHGSEITALMFQPLSSSSALLPSAPRLLATAATDGGIKLWDAKNPLHLIHSLDLGNSPALAMSFTPDGYLVAAASWNKVLFWNAEVGGLPKATWNGKAAGWHFSAEGTLEARTNGNVTNGDIHMGDEEEPTHSLSWDADGRKLAYGVGEQVRTRPDLIFLPALTFIRLP